MRLTAHVLRLLVEVCRFGLSTRRYSVIVLVLLGLLAIALALTAQATAPLAVYPFA